MPLPKSNFERYFTTYVGQLYVFGTSATWNVVVVHPFIYYEKIYIKLFRMSGNWNSFMKVKYI